MDLNEFLIGAALKNIAEVNAVAGSGSGWCYGATVCVQCTSRGINEALASW